MIEIARSSIWTVLLMTLVLALEPIPILLVWAPALAIIGVAMVLIGGRVSTPSGRTLSAVSAGLVIVLGLAIALLALRKRAKARQGGEDAPPRWVNRLGTISPWAAFVPGMLTPPHLLAAAVGNDVVRQNLSTTQPVVAVVLYVVIGSIGVSIPIGVKIVPTQPSGRRPRLVAPVARDELRGRSGSLWGSAPIWSSRGVIERIGGRS